MNKKLSITIGIPAYNEEENIKQLLQSILKQKTANFFLKEIIVVSDQSTDRTIERIKEVKDKRIIILKNRRRLGQALGQNKILKIANGDLIVLLNADVLPKNMFLLQRLVKPFLSENNIGISSPKLTPLSSNDFFENVINFSVEFKKYIFTHWRKGSNLYLCCGGARVFSKKFVSKFKWPKGIVSEDAYSYLACIKEGFSFKYVPNTSVYYKSPSTFKDHQKQSARFFTAKEEMKKYFSEDQIVNSYNIPPRILLTSSVIYFLKHPFMFSIYTCILLYIKLNPINKNNITPLWAMASSSKNLRTQ